uniref:C2H2-type domain-containing protein n=1 Tax=viral metagenome TaxID=1070528 RepID=A0A6C0DT06_9ZZZZ
MVTENSQKIAKKFYCECCDYSCSNKFDFNKHLSTRKHKKLAISNTLVIKSDTESTKVADPEIFCCKNCEKVYKSRKGLWAHNKKCTTKPIEDEAKKDNELLNFLLKENQEFKKIILEFASKSGQPTSTTTINGNNNCNNRFNINMFLNEKCKDAMNIMDFVDSLKLTLQDLEKTAEIGYVKGISNIIVNGLNQLDVYKRPIHCSDVKRETLYVKDNDAWEKENEDKKKITRAIKHISIRNAKQVGEWTKENKGYDDSMNKKSDKYLKIISEANGGEPEEINKIISNISTKVTIDKENV